MTSIMQTRENLITGRPMPARSFQLLTSDGEPDWQTSRRAARARSRASARRVLIRQRTNERAARRGQTS